MVESASFDEESMVGNTDDPQGFDHRFATVNGIRLHFVEEGDGPLVVLLHGYPFLWYLWRHQIKALASAGYRVVAPDQRGYGQTDCPDQVEAYDVTHADDPRVAAGLAQIGVHDMRHVLFDNDTRLIWLTSFDTHWDPYIDDTYQWQNWSFEWEATEPGRHTLRARATDAAGNVQPELPPWNRLGCGNNAVEVLYVDVH